MNGEVEIQPKVAVLMAVFEGARFRTHHGHEKAGVYRQTRMGSIGMLAASLLNKL